MKKSMQLILLGIASALNAEEGYIRYIPYKVHFPEEKTDIVPGTIAELKIQSELTQCSRYLYENMNKKEREMVFQLMHGECKGQNRCKGMNSCKQEGQNHCAGMCECNGQGNGFFPSTDLAVRVAAKHMAEKRLQIKKNNY